MERWRIFGALKMGSRDSGRKPKQRHHCIRCRDRNYIIECKCGCGKTESLRDSKSRKANPYFHRYGWGERWTRDSNGYILSYKPGHPTAWNNGQIMQHRLIMERSLGRLLRDDEEVHHINEKIDDNRIENLQIMSKSEHSKYHHPKGIWGGL